MTSGLIQNIRVGRGANFPSEKLPHQKETEDSLMAENVAGAFAAIQPGSRRILQRSTGKGEEV